MQPVAVVSLEFYPATTSGIEGTAFTLRSALAVVGSVTPEVVFIASISNGTDMSLYSMTSAINTVGNTQDVSQALDALLRGETSASPSRAAPKPKLRRAVGFGRLLAAAPRLAQALELLNDVDVALPLQSGSVVVVVNICQPPNPAAELLVTLLTTATTPAQVNAALAPETAALSDGADPVTVLMGPGAFASALPRSRVLYSPAPSAVPSGAPGSVAAALWSAGVIAGVSAGASVALCVFALGFVWLLVWRRRLKVVAEPTAPPADDGPPERRLSLRDDAASGDEPGGSSPPAWEARSARAVVASSLASARSGRGGYRGEDSDAVAAAAEDADVTETPATPTVGATAAASSFAIRAPPDFFESAAVFQRQWARSPYPSPPAPSSPPAPPPVSPPPQQAAPVASPMEEELQRLLVQIRDARTELLQQQLQQLQVQQLQVQQQQLLDAQGAQSRAVTPPAQQLQPAAAAQAAAAPPSPLPSPTRLSPRLRVAAPAPLTPRMPAPAVSHLRQPSAPVFASAAPGTGAASLLQLPSPPTFPDDALEAEAASPTYSPGAAAALRRLPRRRNAARSDTGPSGSSSHEVDADLIAMATQRRAEALARRHRHRRAAAAAAEEDVLEEDGSGESFRAGLAGLPSPTSRVRRH